MYLGKYYLKCLLYDIILHVYCMPYNIFLRDAILAKLCGKVSIAKIHLNLLVKIPL